MKPAWSCLTSAEFIQSPTCFLIKPFGADRLVVPGRETCVAPALGQGSLQLAPPECPISLQELPLPCCLAGWRCAPCSCFPHPHLSQEGGVSPTHLSLPGVASPPSFSDTFSLGACRASLDSPNSHNTPYAVSSLHSLLGCGLSYFSKGLTRRLLPQGQKALGVVGWMVAQEHFPGLGSPDSMASVGGNLALCK